MASKHPEGTTSRTLDECVETIALLKEENALLRGVLDVLRVDLQIKDDQIDKVRSLRPFLDSCSAATNP